MLPVIALVGRTNVGKSTLFNRLTRSRDALVADFPGLTRDRQYGRARWDKDEYIIVDSGGFEPQMSRGIQAAMAQQTQQAIIEADIILFMVDGRTGMTPHDEEVSQFLRRHRRLAEVYVVVNKTEGMQHHHLVQEFFALGWYHIFAISAAHGEGIHTLFAALATPPSAPPTNQDSVATTASISEESNDHPPASDEATTVVAQPSDTNNADNPATAAPPNTIKLAVVGRPNVGKSTLVNTLLGEERVIAFDEPGTTRDAIYVPFIYKKQDYTLIDTAGLRRRGKVFEAVEKFSAIKTLQAIEDAHVVLLLLDASNDISEQDAHIASYILEAGRALVIAVNKWEMCDANQRNAIKTLLERKLHFLSFASLHFISARMGQGVSAMMQAAAEAHRAAFSKLPTPALTRLLQEALLKQAPRREGFIRPKLRYAHQGGHNPPLVVIHGRATEHIDANYRRYLENTIQKHFKLVGTPLRVEFRNSVNPFNPRSSKAPAHNTRAHSVSARKHTKSR